MEALCVRRVRLRPLRDVADSRSRRAGRRTGDHRHGRKDGEQHDTAQRHLILPFGVLATRGA